MHPCVCRAVIVVRTRETRSNCHRVCHVGSLLLATNGGDKLHRPRPVVAKSKANSVYRYDGTALARKAYKVYASISRLSVREAPKFTKRKPNAPYRSSNERSTPRLNCDSESITVRRQVHHDAAPRNTGLHTAKLVIVIAIRCRNARRMRPPPQNRLIQRHISTMRCHLNRQTSASVPWYPKALMSRC